MIKVYLKSKTFDGLIVKQQMFNVLAGAKYRYNESYYAKGEFYVTFECSIEKWKVTKDQIDKRFKVKTKKEKVVTK